ncbi:hypothetical protein [Rhabdothermincola salaria]|uniref:hypothetical protein n=1 Tax=Rhabdothermincola salaria TaxID=2903142 RepID=UPI001E2AB634|nr:hypothetical protein [Rhabdothermincola salaria]MCD9625077.1 hypothetical protein [Rhabdothermincola salaria]
MRTAPQKSTTRREGVAARRSALARRGLLGVAVVLVAIGAFAVGPSAEPASAQGCGPVLTVSKSQGLDPNGETVTVTGSCFDVNKGIYVAFCVVPPPGSPPSPCGGGVAVEGSGGLSHWISSNPPPYAQGLTVPYGPGGSFSVTLRPSAMLNPDVDCRVVQCAISTRNDHTRASDRGQDGIVPVSFAAPVAPPATEPPAAVPPETVPETVPETTTTTVPPETTTTTEATTTTTGVEERFDEEAELASADGEGSGGPGAGAWVGIVVVLVLLAGGGAALVLRRRDSSAEAS